MKKLSLHSVAIILTLILTSSSFAMFNPNCPSGFPDPESSYDGNWDLHVGGCWQPPEPHTCTVCNYM